MNQRKNKQQPLATVHDHFDGSSCCVECAGPCTLTGAEIALTRLVRYSLDSRIISCGVMMTLGDILGRQRLAELQARQQST